MILWDYDLLAFEDVNAWLGWLARQRTACDVVERSRHSLCGLLCSGDTGRLLVEQVAVDGVVDAEHAVFRRSVIINDDHRNSRVA